MKCAVSFAGHIFMIWGLGGGGMVPFTTLRIKEQVNINNISILIFLVFYFNINVIFYITVTT